MLLTTFVKYCLHCVDMYGAAPWESKSMYIFYLEFVAGTERCFASSAR